MSWQKALTIAEYLVTEYPTRPIFVKLVEDLKSLKRTTISPPRVATRENSKAEKAENGEKGPRKKRGNDRKDVRALLKRADDFIKNGQPEKALEELELILQSGAETEQLFIGHGPGRH